VNQTADMIPLVTLAPEQARLMASADRLLAQARAEARGTQVHRSLRRLDIGPRTVVEMLAVAVLLTTAVVLARPALMQLWQQLILWWAARLDVPLALVDEVVRQEWTLGDAAGSLVPGPLTGVVTAAVVMGTFASTFWMGDRLLPVKYLLRIVCVLQASALVFFMAVPSQFPYTVGGHLQAMLDAGFDVMLALPTLLALGWAVLRVPLWQKFAYPALLVAYFGVMVPHKALLHVLVLQHFSILFMPLMYLCFGLVFDVMVFVALYSWLVSRLPDGQGL
jgi:hypothetical protein